MIEVDYFTDVLCVWAFIGEKRLSEVKRNMSGEVDVRLHFLANFAACQQKIHYGWVGRGGFSGYAKHVDGVAQQFNIKLHSKTWSSVQPTTSMLAHAIIKSVEKTESAAKAAEFCTQLRNGFFLEGMDISQLKVLQGIAESLGIAWPGVMEYFNTGSALADLQLDFAMAVQYQVSVSPAWVFNEGRQRLIGNVGYRVIEANLMELIEQKTLPHAWC